jgi:acetoacetate decarboxylase
MAATISAADVIARAVAMPLASPAYPAPPDRFLDRVSLTVSYRSDIDKVAALVPEPLTVTDPLVSIAFLFMRAPKLGDYYEVAQSISTELNGEPLLFRPAMYAGSVAAVLQGREWWGLPKKFGAPMVRLHNDTLVGTLQYSGAPVARATMAYGHQTMEPAEAERAAGSPGVALKIIPHIDGKPRILELIKFGYEDVVVKEAYTGPGALELYPHALAPLADLPVQEIVSVTHTVSDVTLQTGDVVHDYLA